VDKAALRQLVDLIFDTAEGYFRNRPLIVMALNAAQLVVTGFLIDQLAAAAKAQSLAVVAKAEK
jgi:hypothetical protein